MKYFTMLLMIVLCSSLFCQFFWDEPGIWTSQENMIHSNHNVDLYAVPTSDGFVAIWLQSCMNPAQIYAHKLSLSGTPLWEQPLQLTDSDIIPWTCSAVSDSEDNIIISYYYQENQNIPWLMKLSPDGQITWQRELSEIPFSVRDLVIKSGTDNDIFLACQNNDLDEYITTFFHYEQDGSLSPGWENGLTPGSLESDSWLIDPAGQLSTLFADQDNNVFFQIYSQSASPVLPEAQLIIANAGPQVQSHCPLLQITPQANYLCSCSQYVYCFNDSGVELWQINTNQPPMLQPARLLADNSGFYLIMESTFYYQIYRYNSQHLLQWEISDFDHTFIHGAWLDDNSDLRIINERMISDSDGQFELLEYNSSGELISPENGWICEQGPHYIYDLAAGCSQADDIIWLQKQISSDLSLDLGFYAVTHDGSVISGNQCTSIQTAIDWRLQPIDLYASEEMLALLSDYPLQPGSTDEHERILLQRLDRQGNIIGEQPIDTIFSDNTSLLARDQNIALFYDNDYSDERYLQLVDLAAGQYLWPQPGFLFPPQFTTTILAADIHDNAVTMLWYEGNGCMRAQRLIDGEPVFPNYGLSFYLDSVPYCQKYIKGNFLINTVVDDYAYLIHYLGENGIDWQVSAGHIINRDVYSRFIHNQQGLIMLIDNVPFTEATLGCQLIDHQGNTPWDNGLELYPEPTDLIYGLVEFGSSFAAITYSPSSGQPASFWRYDYQGNLLSNGVELPGSQNCTITQAIALQNGLALLMTQPQGSYHNLIMAYYDLDGNLMDINQQNPFVCYPEFSHQTNVCATTCNDDIFFAWQTMINNYSGSDSGLGNEIILQGWTPPSLESTNQLITPPPAQLSISPNPFNPDLKISWTIDALSQNDAIEIYNPKGQKIWQEKLSSPQGYITWNGINSSGNICPSGIYFIKLNSSQTLTQKAILLK